MIIPIRCKSCGKPLAHLWEEFNERTKKEDVKLVLDDLKLQRYCCRATMMGNIENVDIAGKFKKF